MRGKAPPSRPAPFFSGLLEVLVHALLSGLVFGLYYTLVGLGLNLVFGVMKIVNLAHGDVLMWGAFGAVTLFASFGLHPVLAAPLIMLGLFLVGIPVYALVVPRLLRAKDAEMLSIILFFGLSQMLEAIATLVYGANERSIPGRVLGVGPYRFWGESLPKAWVVSGGVSLLAVLAVFLYLYATRLGTLTRAVMANREEALATGIDVHRVSAIAFGIGLALAGLAGVFAPFMLGSVKPSIGVDINLTAFAVIVMGTLGNPLGTVLGGIVYGVSLMLMQTYLSQWANILPNLLLIGVLLVRPSGLLGRSVRVA